MAETFMALQKKYDGAIRVIAEASKDIAAAKATIARQAEVIAALKAALIDAANGLYNGFEPDNQSNVYKRARAAIALAEGR